MEVKEVIEYLGFNPENIKSIDDLKSNFEKEFVRGKNITEDSDFVKPILGKTYGTIENEVKKSAKSLGLEIDFDNEDFKGLKKVADKFGFVIKKVAEAKDAEINELRSNVGKGNDEKVKEWETKYEKIKKAKQDAESLLSGVKQEYDAFKESTTKEIKNVKLNVLTKDALSKVKFKNDISDFERKGYMSVINEKYIFDIDENEKVVPMDRSGNKIPSSKVTGTFKTIDEILEEEAVAGKLYAMNQDAGKPKGNPITFGSAPVQQKQGVQQRVVAPRLR